MQWGTIDCDDVPLVCQSDEIPTDATTQISYAYGPGEARGPVPSDDLRRGLFQTGAGEEHPLRPGELRPRVAT